MYRTLPLAIAALSLGCLARPATAPTPLSFHVMHSAREATQTAVLALVNDGFRVTQTDSVGMAVDATRTATYNGNQDFVICQLPKQSAAAANRETALLISFRATPAATGSDVTVSGKVTTTYPGYANTSMETGPSETDCVSSGTMERRIRAALR
jgi:hypothetical protein